MDDYGDSFDVESDDTESDYQAEWDVGEYCDETQSDIVSEHSDHMENLGFMCGKTSDSVYTYSKEDYDSIYNKDGKDILGHHSITDGSIHIINEYEPSAKHTLTHEIFHKSSYQSETAEELEEGVSTTYRSGLLEIHNIYDKEGVLVSSNEEGRALNEGITEMKTLDYLNAKGEYEASASFHAYSDEVGISRELDDIVGSETLDLAYFGGDKEGLANEVNRLAKDDNAWNALNNDLEIVSRTNDINERNEALSRIDSLLNRMMETKVNEDG